MGLIGKKEWQCVTLDTAGVPHGGRFGCVDWFREQCERIGLTMAWSRRHHAFMVFSRRGSSWICQEIYRRGIGGKLVCLTRGAFWSLQYLWNKACRTTEQRVHQARDEVEKEYQARQDREYQEHVAAMKKDVLQELSLGYGRTPNAMPLPKRIVTMSERQQTLRKGAAKRRRKRQRRILLPHEVAR